MCGWISWRNSESVASDGRGRGRRVWLISREKRDPVVPSPPIRSSFKSQTILVKAAVRFAISAWHKLDRKNLMDK